jgi:hypothetical protein
MQGLFGKRRASYPGANDLNSQDVRWSGQTNSFGVRPLAMARPNDDRASHAPRVDLHYLIGWLICLIGAAIIVIYAALPSGV